MPGVRPAYFIVLFAHNALLLLGIYSHALEVSSCETPLYGREGGPIVLSPREIHEELITVQWKYNEEKIADLKGYLPGQFSGRVTLNKTSYSLTVEELKTTDSGNFTFISARISKQNPTQCFRLQVQEVLTLTPTVTVINVNQISNSSCVVLLECSSKFNNGVSYRWTVNNKNYSGTTLNYTLKPQEGAITVTCTVSNEVSQISESKSINCPSPKDNKVLVLILVVAGLGCVVFVTVTALVVYYRHRKKQAELDELTVYAEIDDVTSSKVIKPNSLYDSVNMKPSTAKHKPQTVYDEIQFSRMQQ